MWMACSRGPEHYEFHARTSSLSLSCSANMTVAGSPGLISTSDAKAVVDAAAPSGSPKPIDQDSKGTMADVVCHAYVYIVCA